MTTVQDSSNVTSLFGAGASSATKSSAQETEDRFLSLLVAQMKNQDPLNPLDNAQVTSQMAQLSTVQGIEDMNSKIEALAASLGRQSDVAGGQPDRPRRAGAGRYAQSCPVPGCHGF